MHSNESKKIGHIVSHSHWDREWRYPIWQTRLYLVEFIDELVKLLGDGTYPGFLLDGQVIPILDYLETKPQMKDVVCGLIKEGKLQVGPWYTLPDQYPVDGECLVRNLLKGVRESKKLGKVFNVGYTPFGWGQTGQLPQIYQGFGIDTVMVGKKVGKARAPQSEFVWKAPDGSEAVTTRFGGWGRQNFYFKIHLRTLYGIDYESDDWKYNPSIGTLYHFADSEEVEQDHFFLEKQQEPVLDVMSQEMADDAWSTMDESVLESDRLMMNGCDYTAAQESMPRILEKLNATDSKDRLWRHETIDEYLKVFREKINKEELQVVEGELRDGPVSGLTGNALTTRLYLKQINKKAQNRLIRRAEPLAAYSLMLDADPQYSFLDTAWDYMLKAHPHDSINGVMQDKSVKDVEYRLAQAIELSDVVSRASVRNIIKDMDLSSYPAEQILMVVFNPLPYERREVMEAWVTIPRAANMKHFDVDAHGLMVLDGSGKPMGTQWMGNDDIDYCVAEIHTRVFPHQTERHRLFFDTGAIPAGGYKVFQVKDIADYRDSAEEWMDSQSHTSNILKSHNVLENEFLKVRMNPNGTYSIFDKETGRTFDNLNFYEDRGEQGNYWINERPMKDRCINTLGSHATIWSEDSGPMQATLVAEINLPVPVKGDKLRGERSSEVAPLNIKTSLTLKKGERKLDVAIEVQNNHQDHYLKAMFPTGLGNADEVFSGGHFNVDCRSIRPQGPTDGSVWPDMATQPQNAFIDISDSEVGLAFVNDSFTEYEAFEDDERTVGLSLLRCVENWICTGIRAGSHFPSQQGGQSLGLHKYSFSVIPHAGTWGDADIPLEADKFNSPCLPVQVSGNKTPGSRLSGDCASFFGISNVQVRFSAIKKAADSGNFIVRMYNPTEQVRETDVLFGERPVEGAWICNLNEERQEEFPCDGNAIKNVELLPRKILTMEVRFGNGGKGNA
ncbi:MAG: glycoside hydrolase family 38 C-terminal domain-containing protein [Verrucomicrobiota bacterium]